MKKRSWTVRISPVAWQMMWALAEHYGAQTIAAEVALDRLYQDLLSKRMISDEERGYVEDMQKRVAVESQTVS